MSARFAADNHDMNRFLWMPRGNVDRVKLAATLLMTLPGMPVIYYGTEVVFVYERSAGDETVTVTLNFSKRPERRQLPGRDEAVELDPLGSSVAFS